MNFSKLKSENNKTPGKNPAARTLMRRSAKGYCGGPQRDTIAAVRKGLRGVSKVNSLVVDTEIKSTLLKMVSSKFKIF